MAYIPNDAYVLQYCVHMQWSGACTGPAAKTLSERRRRRFILDHARGDKDATLTFERMESLLSEQFRCRVHTTPPTLVVCIWNS
jgi:hypothetical protein